MVALPRLYGKGSRLCGVNAAQFKFGGTMQQYEGIPRFIAVDLCAGAVNAERTVECYVKASTQRKLNRGLAATLRGVKKSESNPRHQ